MMEFSKQYLNLLNGKFSGINLTRINNEEEFYLKQIIDSIEPLTASEKFLSSIEKNKIIVDIGFGGGFPILPLARSCPELTFIGMDARGKKANVVQEIANELGVFNATLLHQRFDEVEFDLPVTVTFKAVGEISDLLGMICTISKLEIFFYKGPNCYELENIEKVLKNWDLFEESSYNLPRSDGRVFLGFRNKNVLRGTSTKKVKFSELLSKVKKV